MVVGEPLHLRRDHREALSGLTGAGRLDRGVERQQILVCSAMARIMAMTSPIFCAESESSETRLLVSRA